MVEHVKAGVVRIDTPTGNGTGFVFETTGAGAALVLTNFHVIEGASIVEVRVNDSNTFRGNVLGYDAYRDLAVLEICCGSFQPLSLGGSQIIKTGLDVVAIGYPLGISGSATVTRGIVSAYRYDDEYQSWVVQTDAPINPGNSGGPLLLSSGELIGINTFIIREDYGISIDGLGFAIARQSIRGVLEDLKQGARIDLPSPSPVPTPTPVQATAGWRTFDNRELGYTIKIPLDWEVDDSDKRYVFFNSKDDFAGVVMFVPDYRISSSERRLSNYIEELRPDYELMEVLDKSTTFFESGGEGSFIRYRSQYDPVLCIQDNYEWLWVYDTAAYWLNINVCEHSYLEYQGVLNAIYDSLIFN